MQLVEIKKKYAHICETTESLLSIMIYKKSSSEVINYLQDQLEKAKNITNITKKNKVNNRFFRIIKYIELNYDSETNDSTKSEINSIFLVGDEIIEYTLTKSEIAILCEYDIMKLYMKCDAYFYIDYFYDVLYNLDFIYAIKITKLIGTVYKLNKNKEKIVNFDSKNIDTSNKITDIKGVLSLCDTVRSNLLYKDIIFIVSSTLTCDKVPDNKNIIFIKKDTFARHDIYDLYDNEIYKKNNIELEKRLNDLSNEKTNTDLYVFGKLKDIVPEYIETYSIKELYIEERKIGKLKEITDSDCLNFKIIPIRVIEDGDSASQFIKNYNGIMGIKYF
jgi:hypothetical protein